MAAAVYGSFEPAARALDRVAAGAWIDQAAGMRSWAGILASLLFFPGCNATPSPPPAAEASAPSAAAAPAAPPATPTEPAATASAAQAPAPPGTGSAAASAGAAAEEPAPSVNVVNIGMHIGGGPNDAVTKEPIKRSVEPHMTEFRRCFALVEEKKGGDFGIDLRIGKDGGKAKASHPRTSMKGKEFERCVVETFERIEFLKPKGGETTVSYSLRFTP